MTRRLHRSENTGVVSDVDTPYWSRHTCRSEPDRWVSLTSWPDHEAPYRNGPEPQQRNCAGCNAPLDVLRRANCEYCGRPH